MTEHSHSTSSLSSFVLCLTWPPKTVQEGGATSVGLLVVNAGADLNGSEFLDAELNAWRDLLALNVTAPLDLCHHFGRKMRKRQRGGIILLGTGVSYPRQLRSFDTLVIAPYDDKSLVAYLQAGSLDELKTSEVKVFMLSLEQPDGLGLTEGWIAEHFAMQPSEVAANLTSLERKGYMLHVPCKFVDDTEAPGYGWVFDPDQFWCDTDLLYGDFALKR